MLSPEITGLRIRGNNMTLILVWALKHANDYLSREDIGLENNAQKSLYLTDHGLESTYK